MRNLRKIEILSHVQTDTDFSLYIDIYIQKTWIILYLIENAKIFQNIKIYWIVLKAIYVDTDLIFMRPVEHLWNEFDNFDQNQVRIFLYLKTIILIYNSSISIFFRTIWDRKSDAISTKSLVEMLKQVYGTIILEQFHINRPVNLFKL